MKRRKEYIRDSRNPLEKKEMKEVSGTILKEVTRETKRKISAEK